MERLAKADCEIMPPSKADAGWQVRITALDRLQYISGFDSEEQAAQWIAEEADMWLSKLGKIAVTL
jgi:hypothetical protein